MPIKQVTITYEISQPSDMYDLKCAQNGVHLNISIYDALNSIRTRLKYCSDDVSESEQKFLEELRAELSNAYIEEG